VEYDDGDDDFDDDAGLFHGRLILRQIKGMAFSESMTEVTFRPFPIFTAKIYQTMRILFTLGFLFLSTFIFSQKNN
jgi:hypothetical protein